MLIRKLPFTPVFPLMFLLVSSLAQAGVLYRYQNENDIQELSRSLPPEIAQHGYDIIDDETMQLIERVPPALTAEELAEKIKWEAEQKAMAEQKEIRQRKQQNYDNRLLATYTSEAELVRARDDAISHRLQQISLLQSKLPKAQAQLVQIQNEAAERELNGQAISENMKKRLHATEKKVSSRKQAIEQYQQEIKTLTQAYNDDLQRLRQLR